MITLPQNSISISTGQQRFYEQRWFKFLQPSVFSLMVILPGCTSVTTRTYDLPAKYVNFAAQEACLEAGFELESPIQSVEGRSQILGNRPLRLGLFVGQGGESVDINVSEIGSMTKVDIESKKRFVGFFAQRHMDERIASYLDSSLKENIALRDSIVGKK